MPAGKRLTPISDRRNGNTNIRWLDSRTSKAKESVQWSSCQQSVTKAFRDSPSATYTNGFYLSNSDLGLLGLGLAAFTPLALAYVGPASAYFITGSGGAIYSSVSVGQALLSSSVFGALAGFIRPSKPSFVNFNKPCSDPNASKF